MREKITWLWNYKSLVKELTVKELKLRYKNSTLGFLWSFLNPMFMMCVYVLVFGRIFPTMRGENYPVYLLSGLLLWNFFSISLMNSSYSLISNAPLIKKIYFPREVFPFANVLSNLINFMLSLIPFFIILALFHRQAFSFPMLLLPYAIALITLMILGIAFFFSMLTLYFRDFIQIIENLLLAWFFLSPVIYKEEMILGKCSAKLALLYKMNPLYPILNIFHCIFYEGTFPSLKILGIATAISVGFFAAGWFYFHRNENAIVKMI